MFGPLKVNQNIRNREFVFNQFLIIWSIGKLLLKLLITLEIQPQFSKIIPVLLSTPTSYLSVNNLISRKTTK
jgi:hypothetical protein